MEVSAQVSLYPLRQEKLGPAIDELRRTFEAHGTHVEVGPMSTLVLGDTEQVFAALKEGFERAAAAGHVVLVITVSNACPVRT